MARIAPFKGIRYNPERVGSLTDVVSPPYDVISSDEQAALYNRSPYNIIRLELGPSQPGDNRQENPHSRAAGYLRRWLAEGILVQETAPALYLTSVTFEAEGAPATRWGLLASVRLEPFDQGGIRPHERTYTHVKSERLALMRACRANLSPIFSFFSDDKATLAQLVDETSRKAPTIAFRGHDGHQHRMWVIHDPDQHQRIAAQLAQQPLFIADGHHRYETALAYRDALAAAEGGLPDHHPANYTLMYISSIHDPGLFILPAHRLLPRISADVRHTFLENAGALFEVEHLAIDLRHRDADKRLLASLDQTLPGQGVAVVIKDAPSPLVLRLKPGRKQSLYPKSMPEVVMDLDVTLLTEVIFPKLLTMSASHLDDVESVHYTHDAREALLGVASGGYDMAFIIKPTPIAAVQRIAETGRVMPRKSTYFAPKAITGLVMHAL